MMADKKAIRAFKARRARRLDERGIELPAEKPDREDYGTSASGNWGHVGRPGERGGSGKGGGGSFRLEKGGKKGGYDSKAKIQTRARKENVRANAALKKAKASGNADKIARAEKRVQRAQNRMNKVNMHRKSALDLRAAGRYDPNANKRLHGEEWTSVKEVANVRGRKTPMKHTFNGTKKDWHKKK